MTCCGASELMNRRTFLITAAAAGALASETRSQMGIAVTSYMSFAPAQG